MKKFLAMFFATLILLAGCSPDKEPLVEVTTQKVQILDGTLPLKHAGTITLSDETEIKSAVSGNVMEKFFADGADVKEGQVLFKIGELEEHTKFLQTKAELSKARTDLAKALAARDESSAAELKAEVDEKQAIVEQMEDAAEDGMIHAPKSGIIEAFNTPPGMTVTAGPLASALKFRRRKHGFCRRRKI